MVFWKSAGAADGVEHAEFLWEAGTALAVHCTMSENQINACPLLVLSWVSVGLQVAMTTCASAKLQVAHELEHRDVKSAGTADGETELRAPEDYLVELRSRTFG